MERRRCRVVVSAQELEEPREDVSFEESHRAHRKHLDSSSHPQSSPTVGPGRQSVYFK